MKVIASIDLAKLSKEELVWLAQRGIIHLTDVRRELKHRGEDEWTIVCELRRVV